MPTPKQLHLAKQSAKERFSHVPGVIGFGLGDGVLNVYAQNKAVEAILPSRVHGVPLKVQVSGKVEALVASETAKTYSVQEIIDNARVRPVPGAEIAEVLTLVVETAGTAWPVEINNVGPITTVVLDRDVHLDPVVYRDEDREIEGWCVVHTHARFFWNQPKDYDLGFFPTQRAAVEKAVEFVQNGKLKKQP